MKEYFYRRSIGVHEKNSFQMLTYHSIDDRVDELELILRLSTAAVRTITGIWTFRTIYDTYRHPWAAL